MRCSIYFFVIPVILFGCERHKKVKDHDIVPESTISWEYADSIKNEVGFPEIPRDTFNVSDFGTEDETDCIQKAIDQAFENGGGTIIVPSGIHYSQPIVLKSRIDLHLDKGAELIFVAVPELYPLVYTWFNGIPCMNYSPMIYAQNGSNIKISGKGIIDGQGDEPVWENMKYNEEADWDLLKDLDDEDVKPSNRKFGRGHSLRPELIGLVACSKIEVSGITIRNMPFWGIHTILCRQVRIRNCTINSQGYDQIGIGLESSENVFVDSVKFRSVDDGIKILSGRVKIPDNKASRNILIQNSVFENVVYSAVTVSSQTKAGAERIFMSGLKVDSAKTAFRILANAKLKGKVHDIFIKNCQGDHILDPFLHCKIYKDSEKKNDHLLFNVYLDQITSGSCGRTFVFNGQHKNIIQNISITNSGFNSFKGSFAEYSKNLILKDVTENKKIWDGNFNIGHVRLPEIKFEKDEDDILDSDDIKYSDLPEAVKRTLSENYPLIPVDDIDRMITRSNVIYEIDLLFKRSKELELLIQSDGKILRSESDITFRELPLPVISVLESYIERPPVPFIINEIKKIIFQDLSYFEIKGEFDDKMFAVGITNEGNMIEEKQKLITSYFPTNDPVR